MVKASRNLQKNFYANVMGSERTRVGEDGSGKVGEIHILTHLRNLILHPCLLLAPMLRGPMIQVPWPWILYNSLRLGSKLVAIPYSLGVPPLLLEVSVGQSGEETLCPSGDSFVVVHKRRLIKSLEKVSAG